MLFLHAPIARQCAAKRNRKISFSGSIAHDSPSVPVCFREAGCRQSLKLARPLGGGQGYSQRARIRIGAGSRAIRAPKERPAAQDFEFLPGGLFPRLALRFHGVEKPAVPNRSQREIPFQPRRAR